MTAPVGPPPDFFILYMGQERPISYAELQHLARSKQIRPDVPIRQANSGWFPVSQLPGVFSDKSYVTALLLSGFLGGFGVDRFYLGYTGLGIAKLLTFGGCGIWSLIDFILIAVRNVPDSRGLPLGS